MMVIVPDKVFPMTTNFPSGLTGDLHRESADQTWEVGCGRRRVKITFVADIAAIVDIVIE